MRIVVVRREQKRTTRRALLGRGIALAGASTMMPGIACGARRAVEARDDHVLVVVELTGGNDGLNTVVPAGHDAYHQARPRLGIARRVGLRLDDDWALHPKLAGLRSLWDDGLLAIVHGVGHPGLHRSHGRSVNVWHTASSSGQRTTGWLGRYLDHVGAEETHQLGLVLGPEAPLAMCGKRFRPRIDARSQCYPYPQLGETLRAVAGRIGGGGPERVYWVTHGGYDTHTGQVGRHARLLAELGEGLRCLVGELRAVRQLGRLAVMVYSEFGRSLAENATGGTDHGQAGAVILIGQHVRAGMHGDPPCLDQLHRGGLAWTTDLRRVYAAVLDGWLTADAGRVPGGELAALPLFGVRACVTSGRTREQTTTVTGARPAKGD